MNLKKAVFTVGLASTLVGANVINANAFQCSDDPLCEMQEMMNKVLIQQNPWSVAFNQSSYLRVDLDNQKDKMVVKVDVPGIDKKDIDVNLSEYSLTISAKREVNKKDKDLDVSERSYGEFKRLIQLPARADVDNAVTTFENGVLEITIPKIEPEKSKTKKLII